MKYTIKHSHIAGVLFVTREDGKEYDCYYISETRPVQVGVQGIEIMAEARFVALPLEVRAAVNKQFGQVFSLPIGCRSDWVKSQVPFDVEVPNDSPGI